MTEVIPVLRENSEWGGRGRVHKKDDEQGGKVERALREACVPMVPTQGTSGLDCLLVGPETTRVWEQGAQDEQQLVSQE